MGAVIIILLYILNRLNITSDLTARAIKLSVPAMAGVLVYFAVTYMLRVGYSMKIFTKSRG